MGCYYASQFSERLVSRKPIDDHLFTSGRAVFQYSGSIRSAPALLRKLKSAGWRHPLDMHAGRSGEWLSYKFSPW